MESKETGCGDNIIKYAYPQGTETSSMWFQGNCIFRKRKIPPIIERQLKHIYLGTSSGYASMPTNKGILCFPKEISSTASSVYMSLIKGEECINTFSHTGGGFAYGEPFRVIPLYESKRVMIFQRHHTLALLYNDDVTDRLFTRHAYQGFANTCIDGNMMTTYGVEYNGLYIFSDVFQDYPNYSSPPQETNIQYDYTKSIPYVRYTIDSNGIMKQSVYYGLQVRDYKGGIYKPENDIEYVFNVPILINIIKNPITQRIFGRVAVAMKYSDVDTFSPDSQLYKCGLYELSNFDENGNFDMIRTIEEPEYMKIGENPEYRKRVTTPFRRIGNYVMPLYGGSMYIYDGFTGRDYNYVMDLTDSDYIEMCKLYDGENFGYYDYILNKYKDKLINFNAMMYAYLPNKYIMANDNDPYSSSKMHWRKGIYKASDLYDGKPIYESRNENWTYVQELINNTGYTVYTTNTPAFDCSNDDKYIYMPKGSSYFVLNIENI